MTPEERAHLTRLAEAATPAPWRVSPGSSGSNWIDAGDYDDVLAPEPVDCTAYCYGGSSRIVLSDPDAALIVAMRNALPDLLADSEELHRLREGLRDYPADFRERAAEAWGGSASWLTTGEKVAELVAYWLREDLRCLLDGGADS